MKKVFLSLIILIFTSTCVYAARNYHFIYNDPSKVVRTIPDEWMVFQPRKIPFIPFSNIDYKKMYETPIDVSIYAGEGRAYNENYKPYYPEKYLYVTDYSFNNFLKYSETYKEKSEFASKESYERSINNEYNSWLWNKIRSDFKRVHGMYNATVTDYRGIKHKITWEDGGIVSIYEQRKLYYEYARFNSLDVEVKAYKFLQNFRFPYKDVRVNNPFIEFEEPNDRSFIDNGLEIRLYSNRHDCSYQFNYEDKYQYQEPNGGVLEYTVPNNSLKSMFMGPDGKLYRYRANIGWQQVEILD